jgi:heme-degrading monooxygenase HmoA
MECSLMQMRICVNVHAMFAVLYRWRLKPGTEQKFRKDWKTMTDAIKAQHGTGGSRLHRSDNGEFWAYAVWPSRQQWEAAGKLPSANPEAGAGMRTCIEQSLPSTTLDVLDDLLSDLP